MSYIRTYKNKDGWSASVRIRRNGRSVHETIRRSSKEEAIKAAREWRKKQMAQIHLGGIDKDSWRFSDLADKYFLEMGDLNRGYDEGWFEYWSDCFSAMLLTEINSETIRSKMPESDEPLKLLSDIFSCGLRWDMVSRNPTFDLFSVAQMLERYRMEVLPKKKQSTIPNQLQQLAWWKKTLGHFFLYQVRREDIHNALQSRDVADSTRNRYLSLISDAFSAARDKWGWIDSSPCYKLRRKEPKGRVCVLAEEETKRLLTAVRERLCPGLFQVVVLGMSTGMRLGEILGLRRHQIDLDSALIVLDKTKNDEYRSVPIPSPAHRVLSSYLDGKQFSAGELIFPAAKSTKKPLCIRNHWKKAKIKAGLPDLVFHGLRHDFASKMLETTGDLKAVADQLGHKSLAMTYRYAHVLLENRREKVEKTTALLGKLL